MSSSDISRKLAIGTVQFGLNYGIANRTGQVSPAEGAAILSLAARHGVRSLDTAIAYGDSERVLGEIGTLNWQIVSKLPAMPDEVPDVRAWVELQVNGSLRRLKADRLHGLILHRPDQLLDSRGKELYEALVGSRERGVVDKIGVSIYAPDELGPLFRGMKFDMVQAPLSILDRRLVESGWAGTLRRNGIELHVRSTFLQGLLLVSPRSRPAKFERWNTIWSEWSRWLEEVALSPLEACLRYALSVDEVDKVVVGVDSMNQLREILAVSTGSLARLPNWPQSIDVDLLNPSRWTQL